MDYYGYKMLESMLIDKAEDCNDEQLNELKKLDYIDNDSLMIGLFSERELVMNYIECFATDGEMLDMYKILFEW